MFVLVSIRNTGREKSGRELEGRVPNEKQAWGGGTSYI
jgi:hypothetical protein